MPKMTKQQFDNYTYQREDPKPIAAAREKANMRRFWAIAVPGGALGAFILCLINGSGGAFPYAWLVLTILIWGAGLEKK